MSVQDDPRLEAGARGLCGFLGINPDEPVSQDGTLIPMWRVQLPAARAVIDAADACDRATPAMTQAGIAALSSGSDDQSGLINRIWAAMTAIRGGDGGR
ncbi:MAG: hypothetical protein AB7S57_22550 [Acetobacteraceae bacterium]